ncbi:MAG TPA: transglycosylase domain-containing protein, partial [Mycobacteriales bacterium]|nr:transglycosylase domain-containing protein [Mycobacteriales bacterium]
MTNTPPRPSASPGRPPAAPARSQPPRRRGRLTRRGRLLLLLAPLLGLLLLVFFLGVLYAVTSVPNATPDEQSVLVLHNDGSELGRIQGEENRTDVPLESLSEPVRQAVLAAEDEGFYGHNGVSPTGIFRALFRNVKGGGVSQGGSTITQQYTKTKFKLSRERSLSRKLKEVMVAVKLERRLSKDEIFENYLNTIYFGRGAYGIEAAAKTYFGVPSRALKVEQAAVLASLIRSPEGGDPARRPELAKKRWTAVLVNMEEEGWLPDGTSETAVYPDIRKPGAGKTAGRLAGPRGHVIKAVETELAAIGLSPEEVSYAGLRVTTTIDAKAQAAAAKAMDEILPRDKVPDDLLSALISVEPGTGAIKAMFGGRDYTKRFINDATDNPRQPGSSFKPVVLAAAIEEGIGLRSVYDGRSPQDFPGRERPVSNYGDSNDSFGRIDLVEATAKSVNTVYFRLALDAGPRKVIDVAQRLGVPDSDESEEGLRQPVKLRPEGGLGLGESEVHVLDQAAVFATFAANGTAATPYLIQRVVDREGKVVFKAEKNTDASALDPEIAADVTFAMQQVVEKGTATGARLDGRPAAGKTGTTQDNADAWFVGFTPQLSTAVWMGFDKPKDKQLKNILGRDVTGGSFPAAIFKRYMDEALQGAPVKAFPPPAYVGKKETGSQPSRAPASQQTPSESPSSLLPSDLPSVEPSPSVVVVEPSSEPSRPAEPSPPPSEPPPSSPP